MKKKTAAPKDTPLFIAKENTVYWLRAFKADSLT